ncbi:MAG: EcsC family protein [Pseudomonadota bacterium]|nr:EcsC family protein [Pseudomonadota bacterium]
MSEQNPMDHQHVPSALLNKLGKRLRKIADQGGRQLGRLTAFDAVRTEYQQREAVVSVGLDPLATMRQQLPQLGQHLFAGRFASASRLMTQLVPAEALERLTERLFEQVTEFAELISTNDDLYEEAGALTIQDMRDLSLERADELADLMANRNRLIAAAEGGATGLGGLIGTLIDLPLSIVLAVRTVYQIAECYGHDLSGVDGRSKVYDVLAQADFGILAEKQTIMIGLASVNRMLQQNGVSGLQQMVGSAADLELFEKLAHDLADSLNINLPPNLLQRAIPIAASATSVLYNTRLINSVAAAAQVTFRAERLKNQSAPAQVSDQSTAAMALPASEVSAEAVFGHSAEDEQVKPKPKKRMVRVKKNAEGEIMPNVTEITPSNDTQH